MSPKLAKASPKKYLMRINGEERYLSLYDAGVVYDSGHLRVEFGDSVLSADGSVQPMTQKDKDKISEAADRHSESK